MLQKLVFAASIISLTFCFPDLGQSQWVETNDSIYAVSCFYVSGTRFFAGSQEGGVYQLTESNGGLSASQIYLDPGHNDIASFASIGDYLFAGIATPDLTGYIYLSTDNGASWTPSLGAPDFMATALVVSGTNLFLGESNAASGFVDLSTDMGSSWETVSTGLNNSAVQCLELNGIDLFAGTHNGVFLTTNNGTLWTPAGLTDTNIGSLKMIGSRLFAGTQGNGVLLSTDNGTSWNAVNNGLTDPIVYSLASVGTNLFAGTSTGIFLTTNNGISWSAVDTGMASTYVFALCAYDTDLYAGISNPGIWHRPLSQMGVLVPSSVPVTETSNEEIQSYPNPFSRSTEITCTQDESGYAEISVFDLLGNPVARLFTGELEAGKHSFAWDASGALPGTYWCLVQSGGGVERVALSILK